MSNPAAESPVRLAIIGAGAVTRTCYLPALPHASGVRLHALVDSDPRQAEAAADLLATEGLGPRPSYVGDSAEEALRDADAAIVCTAHTSHGRIAAQALAAGRHVLVEKPLATTVAESTDLVHRARQAGLIAAVGHVRRLFPSAVWVARLLQSGELGEPVRARWAEGSPYSWPLTSPSMFRANLAGGGVTLETGSHVFDLLMSWFGTDVEVRQYADDSLGGVESESRTLLRFGDVDVDVELSRQRDLGNMIEIVGSAATLRVGAGFRTTYEIEPTDGSAPRTGDVPVLPGAVGDWTDLFAEQLNRFARAVRLGEPPLADATDGLRTVEVAERCYASGGRGALAARSRPRQAPTTGGDFAGKRVMVTGASGFLGGRTVERLVNETDADVVAVVRDYNRLVRLSVLDQNALRFARVDLSRPNQLAVAMTDTDVVIHCAYGNTGDADERWHVTVEGTRAVLDAAREAGVSRVVVVSTLSVYDLRGLDTVTEEAPLLSPDSQDREYPQQKLHAERLAIAAGQDGLDVVVVQPTVIYGPAGPEWTVRALARMATDSAVLPSGDEGVCNAVHVDDVVTALLLAATVPTAAGGRFLVSGSEPTSWGEFYDAYRAMLPPAAIGTDATALPDWERDVYAATAAVRIDRARKVLGYQPQYDLASGMQTVQEWAEHAGLLR